MTLAGNDQSLSVAERGLQHSPWGDFGRRVEPDGFLFPRQESDEVVELTGRRKVRIQGDSRSDQSRPGIDANGLEKSGE